MDGVKGEYKDLLWYYLIVYFLFFNNHGNLVFKKKYRVIKITSAINEKQDIKRIQGKGKLRRERKIKNGKNV